MNPLINPAVKPRFRLDIAIAPAIYARMFLEILGEAGVEPGKLMKGTGLSPADLADPSNLISIEQQIQIYANVASIPECPNAGLLNGKRSLVHQHGVLGYAMQTSANLGQAIRVFNQYFDVVGPVARQLMQIDGNSARLITVDVLPYEPARRVGIEEMLSGNFTLFRQLTDDKFKLQELHLDYPPPKKFEAYEELFQCPVFFEQKSIEMRFDASLLNLKLLSSDPESERVCEARCQELLDRLGRNEGIVDQVRRIIYENPCDRRDIDSVASSLCISARTLRRRLKEANSTFRDVLNEVQQALSVDYLTRTSLSVEEIACLLGYTESSNFRHAFKQWTGLPPSSYRQQHQ